MKNLFLLLLALCCLSACCPKIIPPPPTIITRVDTLLQPAPVGIADTKIGPCDSLPKEKVVYLMDTSGRMMIKYWKDKFNNLHIEAEHKPEPIPVTKVKEQIPLPVQLPCSDPKLPWKSFIYTLLTGIFIGFIARWLIKGFFA